VSDKAEKKLKIRGAIAPVFTAFDSAGQLDLDGQRQLFDFLLEHGGISAYFVRSGMGQMYTFSLAEAEALITATCAHLEGKAPVIAGCNGIWDRHPEKRPDPAQFMVDAIHLSRFAEEKGAAAVVHTVPEALLPKENETQSDLLERFLSEICAAVSIPVILYQPPNTLEDYRLTPEMLARVADIPNLAAAKVSYSDGAYVFGLIRAVAEKDFAYIVGDERVWYAGLYAGAAAAIGQGTILNPQLFNAAQTLFEAGDREAVLRVQDDINALCANCANPQDFLARYVAEKGYPVSGFLRASSTNPYHSVQAPLSEAAYQHFKAMLEEVAHRYSQ